MQCNPEIDWFSNFEAFGGSNTTSNTIKLYVYMIRRHGITDSLTLTETKDKDFFQISNRIPFIYLPG